jgi:hypothetical protein
MNSADAGSLFIHDSIVLNSYISIPLSAGRARALGYGCL